MKYDYRQWTDEQLEEFLRAESADSGQLLLCAEELARRKRESGSIPHTPEQAWVSFRNDYLNDDSPLELPEESGTKVRCFPGWIRRLTAVAAVVALLITGNFALKAAGVDLWKTFAIWSNGSMYVSEDPNATEFVPDETMNPAYIPNLPKWYPEGFELERQVEQVNPEWSTWILVYKRLDDVIMITIKTRNELDPPHYEYSEILDEDYRSGGVSHHLIADENRIGAIWLSKYFEYHLSGNLTLEELKQMIDSIYE